MVPAEKLPNSSYYPESPRPQKQIRLRRKRRRFPATVKICLLAMIFVGLCGLYIAQQIDHMHLSLEVASLEQQANQIQQRNDYLRVQLESTRSLQKIEEIARTQLGMVNPTYSGTLVMEQTPVQINTDDHGWTMKMAVEEAGIYAAMANWLNRVLPLGGVEAGTLRR